MFIMPKATSEDLIGRKIVHVEWNKFDDGRGGAATDPILTFDNGMKIAFQVQETEGFDYGVSIILASLPNPQKLKS